MGGGVRREGEKKEREQTKSVLRPSLFALKGKRGREREWRKLQSLNKRQSKNKTSELLSDQNW